MLLCHGAEKSAHSTLCSILCTFRVPDVFGPCIVCNLNLASTFAILCLARLWKEGTCIDRFPNPLILGRLSSQLGNLTRVGLAWGWDRFNPISVIVRPFLDIQTLFLLS